MARRRSTSEVIKSLLVLAAPIALMLALVLWPRDDPQSRMAVDELSRVLRADSDRAVRGISARSLGQIGHPRAAVALLAAAGDDDLILPEIIQALAELGVTPTELKDTYLKKRLPKWRQISLKVFFPARDWLLQFDVLKTMTVFFATSIILVLFSSIWDLYEDSRKGRRRSVGAIVRSKVLPAALLLCALVTSYVIIRNIPPPQAKPDDALAEMAIIELARETRDVAVVEWLIGILRDTDRGLEFRWRAAEALGAIGEKSALTALIETLNEEEPRLRLSAAWAIGNVLIKKEDLRDKRLELRAFDVQYAEELTRLLETRSSSGPLYLLRGRVYTSLGRYMEAIRDFDRARALTPVPGFLAEVHAERGFAFALEDRPEDALREYDRAVALDPHLEVAYFRRGLVRSSRGNWEGAVLDLSRSLELNTRNRDALLQRGFAYEVLGRKQEAADDFSAYLAAEPSSLIRADIEKRIEKLEGAAEVTSKTRGSG